MSQGFWSGVVDVIFKPLWHSESEKDRAFHKDLKPYIQLDGVELHLIFHHSGHLEILLPSGYEFIFSNM
jgi:hypothetical protein